MGDYKELDYKELTCNLGEAMLPFETTQELSALDGIIGQKRAVAAFDFALHVKTKGYNIYMAGGTGLGKTTYAKTTAQKKALTEPVPEDWCYVYNFHNPRCPQALCFAPGKGKQFQDDMTELIEMLTMDIPKAFNSDDYEKQKHEVVKQYQDKRDELLKTMSEDAKEFGFAVKVTNSGIYFMPELDGETLNEEEYEQLSDELKDEISKNSDVIQDKAAEIMRSIKEFEKNTRQDIDDLDYKVGMFALGHHFDELTEKYKDHEKVLAYLKDVQEDILDNIENFVEEEPEDEESLAAILPWVSKKSADDLFSKYKVNLFIDHSDTQGAPVIVDYNPTFYNLVGEVEYDNEYGNLVTDFMKIKPGLFHKANGGYLILQAQDVISNVQSWEALRRAMTTDELAIESLREQMGGLTMLSLKPEPIPCNIKVILVGSSFYYELLDVYDDHFSKIFKIRADFDYEMGLDNENVIRLAQFIKSYCDKEKLPPFDVGAVREVVLYSARLAERKDKLATKFSQIAEILCEAAAWGKMEDVPAITAFYVKKAINERENRFNLYEEKLSEMIEENVVMIDTEGSQVAKINGLAVIDDGRHVFGKPTRITATAYMGEAGIINIEKEADMSGNIHNKGVQVLTGYLGQKYAQDFPLSLSCRVCFEQNYSGIDGDSASSTELYAILSSLSSLPINQEMAVTGSINQMGEIQPIGGVTYKIEGFFDLCRKRGLTGGQGVIIPHQNVIDLVLKDEVIQAVKNGQFHIYPIQHVDEGIEILTGTEAETVHDLAYKKLRDYYRKSMSDGKRPRER